MIIQYGSRLLCRPYFFHALCLRVHRNEQLNPISSNPAIPQELLIPADSQIFRYPELLSSL